MVKKNHVKLIHEGEYVAEVDVELTETGDGWSPYLPLDDAQRIDEVRKALRQGDIKKASRIARIFRLTPVTA